MTLPKVVDDAVKASKRKEGDKDYLNVLHTVDFIHLGALLFDAYSKGTPQELHAKLKDAKNAADLKALQESLRPFFSATAQWSRRRSGPIAPKWNESPRGGASSANGRGTGYLAAANSCVVDRGGGADDAP